MKSFLAILLSLLLAACSSTTGICRHTALYCAHVLDDQTQCEVVCGRTVEGNSHCQARCVIGGKIEWIRFSGGECSPGALEYRFEPGKTLTMSVTSAAAYMEVWEPNIGKKIK